MEINSKNNTRLSRSNSRGFVCLFVNKSDMTCVTFSHILDSSKNNMIMKTGATVVCEILSLSLFVKYLAFSFMQISLKSYLFNKIHSYS